MDDRFALRDVGDLKRLSLRMIPRTEKGKRLLDQALPPGRLDVPFYAQQKEGWDDSDSTSGCANACFRMIFGSIIGWMPSQAAVSDNLVKEYGTSVVDDSVYAKVYQTEVFSEVCDKDVTTMEIIGADFEMLDNLTSRIKQKRPESEVYCTVNLASQTAGEQVWHTSVLLEAGHGSVIYHDPSNHSGGAYKREATASFLSRWAIAYNRAVLTIAA